jgi:hypothetical protein
VTVRFRLSKLKDLEAQRKILLRATIELLRQIPGDATLLFNGEVVWLLRKGGELILNSNQDLWRPDSLALVTLPYTVKDLPTL